MAVKGRSARGEIVDFDLLRIKEQISTAPPSIDVKKRQDFVESRLRRTARKKVPQELLDNLDKNKIEVDPILPSVETVPADMIDEKEPKPVDNSEENKETLTKKKSKQRARPKSNKTEK